VPREHGQARSSRARRVWVAVYEDISERKRADELLRTAHRDLQRRVQERTTELSKANAALVYQMAERERAEREKFIHQARFRALIEKSSDVVSVSSAEGKITYMSPGVERILGRDASEFIGMYGYDFVHPDDLESMRKVIQDLAAQPSKAVNFEFRAAHKDGPVPPFEATGTKCWRTLRFKVWWAIFAISPSASRPRKRCGARKNSSGKRAR
jgi:PAS domain S-box-containing protein